MKDMNQERPPLPENEQTGGKRDYLKNLPPISPEEADWALGSYVFDPKPHAELLDDKEQEESSWKN